MTPGEKNVVKSLIAVAWADGQIADAETSVVEGLLAGFDATAEEEQELTEWAKSPRTVAADVPVSELSLEDRELLLSNAALLTMADGRQATREARALLDLVAHLGLDPAVASAIIDETKQQARSLASKVEG
jgi:uncharacterized membrane protein YebE (DUF533 family)